MNTKVWSDPIEVPNRLKELGLDQDILLQAVQAGQLAWANCTQNHPALYRGIRAWGETTFALRESLIPLGWKRVDDGNLPITMNRLGTVAITVATGDEFTGLEIKDKSPCTKSNKGPRTRNAVTNNHLAHTLFGDIRLLPADMKKIKSRMTWLLMFTRDLQKPEVRCELSLPSNMTEEGQVGGWLERIILAATPLGGDTIKKPTDVPQTPTIDIAVKRRRG